MEKKRILHGLSAAFAVPCCGINLRNNIGRKGFYTFWFSMWNMLRKLLSYLLEIMKGRATDTGLPNHPTVL
jgi:hypothetical protein